MLRGLFITGTDTNVGKTVVAAAFMHRYRQRLPLKYWKPIQTGVGQDDDTRTVERLGACAEREICRHGIRLQEAVAPYLAAKLEGTSIHVADLEACVDDRSESTRWIVEGAGGALVPINDSEFMTDVMLFFGMPALVVARSELGTINHTLMTLEVLRSRSIRVAGVVMVGEPNAANREAIEKWGGVPVVGEMPRFPVLESEALRLWVESHLDPQGHLQSFLG